MPIQSSRASAPVQPAPVSPVIARLLRRARAEFQSGELKAAEQSLTNVLSLAPNNAEASRWMALIAQMRGDHARATDYFRKALVAWPNDPALFIGLGIASYEQGKVDQAVSQFRRACELAPTSASAWYNLGEALRRQVQTDEGLAALQQAISLDPAHIAARLTLAHVQVSKGQFDAAVREFRDVLHREPENAKAWFGLSNLSTVRFNAEETERLRRAFEHSDPSAEAHNLLGFALGKALEQQDNYTQAFAIFQRTNAAQRKLVKWDGTREHKLVDGIMRAFANPTPAPLDPTFGRDLIQVVSIPRSGSTLVEQILASHPEVEGANEIEDMPQVIDEETHRRASPFPSWVSAATQRDWRRLGEEYMTRTSRWRQYKPRFTDKNLVNWHLVGATLAMLPAAKVVIVRRDPMETCLACYRQWFSRDTGFAYDLDEMADYYIDFLRLTRFWLAKYPNRMFDLEYETLLAEPDSTIRRLLDFCDLRFDPACVNFNETSRIVLSASSAMQVRQPLRRDTARAACYGDKLDHLRQRFQTVGLLSD